MMDTASQLGFACVEVACWPVGKAERRYAGVSHIDVQRVLDDPSYAQYLRHYAEQSGVDISSLAFYPNTMDGDLVRRAANIAHLKTVIQASAALGVNMVTTFIGRDQTKPWTKIWSSSKRSGRRSSIWPRSSVSELQLKTVRCFLVPISGPAAKI